MSQEIDLKQIERKAFRSTYQDGLWDIFFGLVVVSMAIYMYHPEGGYSARNIIGFLVGYGVANLIFWAGKKFITLPLHPGAYKYFKEKGIPLSEKALPPK